MQPLPGNRPRSAPVVHWGLFGVAAAGWTAWCFAPAGCPPWFRWAAWVAGVVGLGRAVLVRTAPRRIPVLNYHSVSPFPEWIAAGPNFAVSPAEFERHLRYLQARRYRTLFISEVHARLAGAAGDEPGAKEVALTLDDGYADNWIAAFPLLRKYRMKATVFVTADFIDPEPGARPTLDDLAADAPQRRRPDFWAGYLRAAELLAMSRSGWIEIQAHGATHGRVFSDTRLKGFVSPDRPNLFLFWDADRARKVRWWREIRNDRALWGHPVFTQGPALAHPAYRPDPRAVDRLLAWTRRQAPGLFRDPRWPVAMRQAWTRAVAAGGDAARRESDEAYDARVADELRTSRATLEGILGRDVRFLCWPENAFTPRAHARARDLGFLATVSNHHDTFNRIGEAPDRIARTWVGRCALGFAHPLLDHRLTFVWHLKRAEGNYLYYPLTLAATLIRRVVLALRKKRTSCSGDLWSLWE